MRSETLPSSVSYIWPGEETMAECTTLLLLLEQSYFQLYHCNTDITLYVCMCVCISGLCAVITLFVLPW